MNLDIDSDNGIIRLRGPVEAMEEAKVRRLSSNTLETFLNSQTNFSTIDCPCQLA